MMRRARGRGRSALAARPQLARAFDRPHLPVLSLAVAVVAIVTYSFVLIARMVAFILWMDVGVSMKVVVMLMLAVVTLR